ncbi:hypothetical protein BZA77DRAFT_314080, partial [Pyronema omphalodes]
MVNANSTTRVRSYDLLFWLMGLWALLGLCQVFARILQGLCRRRWLDLPGLRADCGLHKTSRVRCSRVVRCEVVFDGVNRNSRLRMPELNRNSSLLEHLLQL